MKVHSPTGLTRLGLPVSLMNFLKFDSFMDVRDIIYSFEHSFFGLRDMACICQMACKNTSEE